jgi:hypothetical protein
MGKAAKYFGILVAVVLITACSGGGGGSSGNGHGLGNVELSAPAPLLTKVQPVDWWFVFKFNGAAFPGCAAPAEPSCLFGGTVKNYSSGWSQQFVYASSENPTLQQGSGCLGDTTADPVGATFDQVYNGLLYYVVWNDQFYSDPNVHGCGDACSAPWGHSKGMIAWDDDGDGFVMQVSTPDWPGAGSASHPRIDGNTLGCVEDNNVKVSQHFFALKLSKDDVVMVLQGLQNASVVTDPTNLQIVFNGGPSDIQDLVEGLGQQSSSTTNMMVQLSTGITMISKPSDLNVPPWQMVSATLSGVPLRAATWWADPEIPTTTDSTTITCWNGSLGNPGAVQIAATGQWQGTTFNLEGGPQLNANHAKLGVSTDPDQPLVIFGDLNQQGTLTGTNCASSQNGRGGTFYVLSNSALFGGVTDLIRGGTADADQ